MNMSNDEISIHTQKRPTLYSKPLVRNNSQGDKDRNQNMYQYKDSFKHMLQLSSIGPKENYLKEKGCRMSSNKVSSC